MVDGCVDGCTPRLNCCRKAAVDVHSFLDIFCTHLPGIMATPMPASTDTPTRPSPLSPRPPRPLQLQKAFAVIAAPTGTALHHYSIQY